MRLDSCRLNERHFYVSFITYRRGLVVIIFCNASSVHTVGLKLLLAREDKFAFMNSHTAELLLFA